MSLVHLNHEAYAGGTVDGLTEFPLSPGHKDVVSYGMQHVMTRLPRPTSPSPPRVLALLQIVRRTANACCTQISANPTFLSHLQWNQQDHLGRMPLISCLSWEDTLDSRQKTLYPTSRYAKTSACVSKDLTRSLF